MKLGVLLFWSSCRLIGGSVSLREAFEVSQGSFQAQGLSLLHLDRAVEFSAAYLPVCPHAPHQEKNALNL